MITGSLNLGIQTLSDMKWLLMNNGFGDVLRTALSWWSSF